MAIKTDIVPEEIDFSDLDPPVTDDQWLPHLFLTFTVITLFRLLRALDFVNWCHRWLIFLSTVATAAGRARRAERFKLAAELTNLRAKLQTLNMVDQFAQYSRCERRIKVLERQLSESRPETFTGSVIRTMVVSILLFVLEGVFVAWLVARAPSETFSEKSLQELRDSYFAPLLYGLQYVPAKLILLLWIVLCHIAARPIAAWCKALVDRPPPDVDKEEDILLDQGAAPEPILT